jgi:hypothetical protein
MRGTPSALISKYDLAVVRVVVVVVSLASAMSDHYRVRPLIVFGKSETWGTSLRDRAPMCFGKMFPSIWRASSITLLPLLAI